MNGVAFLIDNVLADIAQDALEDNALVYNVLMDIALVDIVKCFGGKQCFVVLKSFQYSTQNFKMSVYDICIKKKRMFQTTMVGR